MPRELEEEGRTDELFGRIGAGFAAFIVFVVVVMTGYAALAAGGAAAALLISMVLPVVVGGWAAMKLYRNLRR